VWVGVGAAICNNAIIKGHGTMIPWCYTAEV
jgi:hypothetical protein